jgi:hypothetical protein
MKSLYAQYFEEIKGYKTIENDKYFFSYYIDSEEDYLFITSMFIKKNKRTFGAYKKVISSICETAKNEGVSTLFGKVEGENSNSDYILKMHKKIGMVTYLKNTKEEYLYIAVSDLEKYRGAK